MCSSDLFIDFHSHFILSLIDVYRDTVTRDLLIFSSAITRILYHFSVSFAVSTPFSVMGTIDRATVRQSEAQLRPRRPRIETNASSAATAPFTSVSLSFVGEVTLEAIMAQLVHMDARLDTLSDELFQVNTRVGRIAR